MNFQTVPTVLYFIFSLLSIYTPIMFDYTLLPSVVGGVIFFWRKICFMSDGNHRRLA